MKTFFAFLFPGLVGAMLWAQAPTVSRDTIRFGNVLDTQTDSQVVWIYNPGTTALSLKTPSVFGIYDSIPYTYTLTSSAIAPGDSARLVVHFQPVHNLKHVLPFVIPNSSGQGPILLTIEANGQFSDPYYNSTYNLSEEALKQALRTRLASGYIQHNYSDARDQMYMVVDNQRVNGQGAAQNTLECMYTSRLATGYSRRSEAQINDQFNTEHVWPQGLFNSNLPMRSDLHHLFPTWSTANSQRANYPFGMVNGTPDWQSGGSKLDNGVFEPRDYAKGKVARAMMYFVIRYQNYANFMNAQESILRTWHRQYLPDPIEKKRNADIAAFQGNKNPFIDYPQFLDRIHSLSNTSVAPSRPRLVLPENQIDFGLVRRGEPATYHFVLVNDGNQPIDLSNFSLDDPHVQFVSGGNPTTLQAQQAHVISLELDSPPAGAFSATLNLSTNSPSGNLSVPIQAFVQGATLLEGPDDAGLRLFPSPAQDHVVIERLSSKALGTLSILDMRGATLQAYGTSNASRKTLSLENLAPGSYLLRIQEKGRIQHLRFVKR